MRTFKARCPECQIVIARDVAEGPGIRATGLAITHCPRKGGQMNAEHQAVLHLVHDHEAAPSKDGSYTFYDLTETEGTLLTGFYKELLAERRTPEQRIENALEILENEAGEGFDTMKAGIRLAIKALKS